MLVHFPIVFFLCLSAFDVTAWVKGVTITGRSVAGTVSVGLAALSGLSAIAAYTW